MEYTVYGLHLGDYYYRYIGVTRKSIKERLKGHFSDILRNRNPHKCNWLKNNKNKVQITPLYESISTIEEAEIIEKLLIEEYKKNNLLNKNAGGSLLRIEKQKSVPWNKGIPCSYKDKLKNSPKSRKVYQYDLEGNFITEYHSIKSASISTGCARPNILNCANLKYKQSNGIIWRFFKEDKIEKYQKADDSIRIKKVKDAKIKSARKIKITKKETNTTIVFKNYKEAAFQMNLKSGSILAYCRIRKETKKYKYEYN